MGTDRGQDCSDLAILVELLLLVLMTGCGGGGGDGNPPPSPAIMTISGTAATGAAINGGAVQMVCASGTIGPPTTTASDGTFTVTAMGSPPCAIEVTGGTGNVGHTLFSLVGSSVQARANVNQLTNSLTFLVAGGDPGSLLFQSPSSLPSKVTAASITTNSATIETNVVVPLAAAAGVPVSFDFLGGAFAANGTGFDQLLSGISTITKGTNQDLIAKSSGLLLLQVNTGSGALVTWFDVFGNNCGNLKPGCTYVNSFDNSKANWIDDPLYSTLATPQIATIADTDLGYMVTSYGYFGVSNVFYDYYTGRAIN